MTKSSVVKGRPLYSWAATDQRAVECLRKILPYLRVKRTQALNCLELRKIKEISKKARWKRGRGHIGPKTRSNEHTAKMERFYMRAKELNATGI